MWNAPRLLAAAACVVATITAVQFRHCCLCDKCAFPLKERLDATVTACGKTCAEAALEAADPTKNVAAGSPACLLYIQTYRRACCEANFTPDYPSRHGSEECASKAQTSRYPQGGYKPCNICKNGGRPAKPNVAVAMLDTTMAQIATVRTCGNLYEYGMSGNVEERMCRPAQNYFHGPCGCP